MLSFVSNVECWVVDGLGGEDGRGVGGIRGSATWIMGTCRTCPGPPKPHPCDPCGAKSPMNSDLTQSTSAANKDSRWVSRGARCDLVTITNHDAALERVARYVAYVREDALGAGYRSEPTNGPETRAQICEVTVPLNRNNTSFGRLHQNWDCAAWKLPGKL